MKSILTFFGVLFFIISNAQTDSAKVDTAKMEFKTVQIQAMFPGGPAAWVKYLLGNLHREVAGDNIVLRRRQKDSVQTVVVSFLVDTTGAITEVKVENPWQVHPKVGAEAVRVIQKGPKWVPATQNDKKVIYRQKQLISFQVAGR